MRISSAGALHRPIVVVVGLLMAAVVVLGVTGMLSSMVIAQVNRGMASAVNQSGTLRMQSYRIGVALAHDQVALDTRRARVRHLSSEFEQRLTSPRLIGALPALANDPVRLAYERVRWRWVHEMRGALQRFLDAGDDPQSFDTGRSDYLALVDDFVDDIHTLVRVLEERAEHHIELLRWIQAVALVLTVGVVIVTLVVIQRRVVGPLDALLACADRVRRGDFSPCTRFVGRDELGRVGAAMNLMTDGLSQIYGELEARVADKTRDLAHTNRSLTLLYRISRILNESPVSDRVLGQVLGEVRDQLGLAGLTLCLSDAYASPDGACIGTGDVQSLERFCAQDDTAPWAVSRSSAGGSGEVGADENDLLCMPVGDQDHRFGTLWVFVAPERPLAHWQRPLLESLAAHLATALNLKARMHEGRRLALHEERSVLARELHDSLAQSLSYLKIQAARLDIALRESGDPSGRSMPAPAEILARMRVGISSAYRELRELLTTFRLRIDGRGLANALAETVRELSERSEVEIVFEDRLPPTLLSPNEEVHVLQVIREALSNVVRHAQAQHCSIRLQIQDGEVDVLIADDGRGLAMGSDGRGHYGLTIMRERAQTLGGRIDLSRSAFGGTRARLHFRPRGFDDGDPQHASNESEPRQGESI